MINTFTVVGDEPRLRHSNAPLVAEPLDDQAALALRDDDGFVTVVLEINEDDLVETIRQSTPNGFDDEHDVLHNLAFQRGTPEECAWRVVGLGEWALLVEYTTRYNGRDDLGADEVPSTSTTSCARR